MTNVGRSGARLGLAFAAALAWLPGPAGAEERVVNFYNWSNYVAPDVLDAFTRETRHQGGLRHV
ncbi:spermidine/putrescine-binding protein [Bradyrhizobium sp. LM2.9]